MIRSLRLVPAIAVLFAATTPASGDPVSPGSMVRASRTASGGDADGDSVASAISADGTVVAFSSTAGDLVPGDTNGVADTFVRDLKAGTIERVSLSTTGTESDVPTSWDTDISGDGRWVAFTRFAPSSPEAGVFLHDRVRRVTTRINIDADGKAFFAFRPSVSGDGTAVAMLDFNRAWLWTRDAGSARPIVDPVTGRSVEADEHDLSADGSTLVFALRFPWHLVVYDIARNSFERVYDDPSFKFSATLSTDGRYVGFIRVREGTFFGDLVIFDRQTGESSILQDAIEAMGPARMASDGRHVVFGSIGLSPAAPIPGTWIWDRVTNQTRFASADNNGLPTSGNQPEAVSHDASAFTYSTRSALEPDDRNDRYDIYVRDRRGPCAVACLLPS